MTKKELIDRIIAVNRRTTREFLAEFSIRELADYLRQLDKLDTPPQEQPARATTALVKV